MEMFLTAILIFLFVFLTAKCLPLAKFDNLTLISWKDIFLPYGVIFFTLSGDTAIPEVCRVLKNEKKKIKSAIIINNIISAK